jgi:ABC-type nitrate/sulfonate/bicarbonate transport system substrate-binding protein
VVLGPPPEETKQMATPKGLESIGRRRALALGAAALATTVEPRRRAFAQGRAANIEPVTIVNTAGTFAATVQQLMKDKRYLEEGGLRPTFLNVGDGSKILGALLSGQADICIASGFSQVLPAIERGGRLKVLAGSEVLLLHLVYAWRPEIKTLKDLEGRTVGTGSPGALLHSILVALLRKNNVDPGKVRFVNVGSSADVFRAIVAKVVDAGPAELDYEEQEAKYNVHGLSDGKFWDGLPEYTNQASYASERSIRERRDVIVRTLAAYARIYRFISSPQSRDTYLAARATALSKDEPMEALAQWSFFQKHKSFAVDLVLSEERVRYMQELNISLGVQKGLIPYEKVTDMSLARDALKLIEKAQ